MGSLYSFNDDVLAADSMAAKYRIKTAHPIIHKVSARLQRNVFANPERYLPQLVRFLIRGSKSRYETVKRLHDWITYNISYDSDLFMGLSCNGSRSKYGAIKQRKTTCSGFAKVFQQMGRLANLKVVLISAYSKNYKNARSNKISGHVWAGVLIKNKWYLVDCSADARSSYYHGKFSEKRKYKFKHLFIHPQAKIYENLPKKAKYRFLDKSMSFSQWRYYPRVNGFYYGFGINFLTNIKKIIHEGQELREGGKLASLFDQIDLRKHKLTIKFSSSKRISSRAYLRDEEKVIYKNNVLSYYNGKNFVVEISPPRPGLYTLNLMAKMQGGKNSYRTFYKCKIKAQDYGISLPEKIGRFYKQRQLASYGVKINQQQIKNGVCMVDISFPKGYSAYAILKGLTSKKSYRKRWISYLSDTRRRYFFSTQGAGPFFLKIYAKKIGREKYHQQVAVARVSATTGFAHPLQELVYSKRWLHSGLKLLSENVTRSESSRGVYRVSISSPNREMTCTLKDSDGKNQKGSYYYSKKNGVYTFHFGAPRAGRYRARIYKSKGKNKKGYNTVISFDIAASQPTEQLPLDGILYYQRPFSKFRLKLLKNDVTKLNRGRKLYHLKIKAPRGYRMSCVLRDVKNKRQRNHYLTQQQGQLFSFYFTAPSRGHYLAKIYLIDRKKKYRLALQFSVVDSSQGASLPLAGQFYQYSTFSEKGFRLLSSPTDFHFSGSYQIKIKAPRGRKMSCRLLNEEGRKVKGSYKTQKSGSIYSFTFNPPDGDLYKAKIYMHKDNGKRSTIGWVKIRGRE